MKCENYLVLIFDQTFSMELLADVLFKCCHQPNRFLRGQVLSAQLYQNGKPLAELLLEVGAAPKTLELAVHHYPEPVAKLITFFHAKGKSAFI